jgi:hypothetical protein
MIEGDIMRRCLVAGSKLGSRLFRVNTGMGWAGKVEKHGKPVRVVIGPKDVVIRNARPLHAGLVTGGSDIIGITPVVITAAMVGMTLGVFSAVETKTPDGVSTSEQENFIKQIKSLGGLAGVARCPEDAIQILSGLSNGAAVSRAPGA